MRGQVHPCKKSEPVAIGQLERFLGDRPELASTPKMAPKNGKKVAVVGSGPSGITCAGELARNGFDVTVFEPSYRRRRAGRTASPSSVCPRPSSSRRSTV